MVDSVRVCTYVRLFDLIIVLHLQHEELASATTDLNANLTHTKKALEVVLCIIMCVSVY